MHLGTDDPVAKQLMQSVSFAGRIGLGLIDKAARVIAQFPPTFDRDLTVWLEMELNLELADGELDERRTDKLIRVQVRWDSVHWVPCILVAVA